MRKYNWQKSLMNVAVFCLMTTAANAQNDTQKDGPSVTRTMHQYWQSICVDDVDKSAFCLIRQQRTVEFPNGQFAEVIVIISRQNEGYIIEIKLPLGLDLRSGLTMQVDQSKEINLPFTTCVTKGCIAMSVLDEAMISIFKVGSQLQIGFNLVSLNEKLLINASLHGFSRAFAMIK